jgi:hypothetical protein
MAIVHPTGPTDRTRASPSSRKCHWKQINLCCFFYLSLIHSLTDSLASWLTDSLHLVLSAKKQYSEGRANYFSIIKRILKKWVCVCVCIVQTNDYDDKITGMNCSSSLHECDIGPLWQGDINAQRVGIERRLRAHIHARTWRVQFNFSFLKYYLLFFDIRQ